MRRPRSGLLGLAALATLAVFPTAAAADDVNICAKQSGEVAIAACSRVIASGQYGSEELAIFYLGRGLAYKNSHGLDGAIADFDEAIRLDPNNASAYALRGATWRAKGDLDRAIADYDQAIRLDPKDADTYTLRGIAWEGNGDFDRAIADFDRAIKLDPKDANVYTVRGIAWVAKGDLDRGIADDDQAIRIDPNNASTYDNRGIALAAKGDLDRAIADYDQAIRLDPRNASWYFHRGLAKLYAGALPKAQADLDRASALNPRHPYAALWRDIVDKRNHRPSRLAEAAPRISMKWWPAPLIRFYLGELTPEALLAAADDPNPGTKQVRTCEVNFFTGELALQQGKTDEAKRLFGLAAADCPKDFDAYAGARAELKMLGANPGTRLGARQGASP